MPCVNCPHLKSKAMFFGYHTAICEQTGLSVTKQGLGVAAIRESFRNTQPDWCPKKKENNNANTPDNAAA